METTTDPIKGKENKLKTHFRTKSNILIDCINEKKEINLALEEMIIIKYQRLR